jgi:hypothetical protein
MIVSFIFSTSESLFSNCYLLASPSESSISPSKFPPSIEYFINSLDLFYRSVRLLTIFKSFTSLFSIYPSAFLTIYRSLLPEAPNNSFCFRSLISLWIVFKLALNSSPIALLFFRSNMLAFFSSI